MLSIVTLRQHMRKILFVVIILIIPSFVLWGAGESVFRKFKTSYLGKVFKRKIDLREFQFYRMAVEFQTIMRFVSFGLDPAQASRLAKSNPEQLDDKTWERIAMLEKAHKEGILVTDAEISQNILEDPLFRDSDGAFSSEYYQLILSRAFQIPPHIYESMVRDNILIRKTSFWIPQGVKTTHAEIDHQHRLDKDRVRVAYIPYDAQDFESDIRFANTDIQNYFHEHVELFRIPAQSKIQYIRIPFQQFEETVTVSEEDIQSYYASHADDYQNEERVSARHILISHKDVQRTSNQERTREEALEKATALALTLRAHPENFSDIAKKESDGPSASEGGDLGSFGPQQMVQPFWEAARRLDIDSISDPVETNFGFHIIQTYEKQEASQLPLELVQDEIRDILKKTAIEDKAHSIAKTALKDVLDLYDQRVGQKASQDDILRTLADVGQRYGLDVTASDWFSDAEPVTAPWYFSELLEELKNLHVGEPCDLILENQKALYLFQLDSQRDTQIPTLDMVIERVQGQYIHDRSREAAMAKANDDRTRLIQAMQDDPAASFQSLAKTHTLPLKEPDAFGYQGQIPEISDAEIFIQQSFALRPMELSQATAIDNGYALIYVLERIPAINLEKESEEYAALQQRVQTAKARQIEARWQEEWKKNVLDVQYRRKTDH